MQNLDILLTSELDGGSEPFERPELALRFHRWSHRRELPPLVSAPGGALWAFIDWVLPDIAGIEVCRRLRCDPLTAQAHITMIMDGEDQDDRKRALRGGADDYMTGPVNRNALLERVLAARVRDREANAANIVGRGALTIDLAAFQARWDGHPVALMPNEFRLLRFFVEHPGRVFTRSQLIAALGKQDPALDERTVDVWIGRLRRALRGVGAGNPLRTVRSLGYVFDA
jgi:two-component system phosphate regulon response regulator PhoB